MDNSFVKTNKNETLDRKNIQIETETENVYERKKKEYSTPRKIEQPKVRPRRSSLDIEHLIKLESMNYDMNFLDKELEKGPRKRIGSIRDKKKKADMKKFDLEKISPNKIRKNKKKVKKGIMSPKKINNKISVVGKVSAKLNALIQRLEQNTESNPRKIDKCDEKVVMAPRIKEAIQKFNKRREKKPELIRFNEKMRKKREKPNFENNNNNNRDNKYNNSGYPYKEEENNEEEEYEEDEEYEEEEDDEEEEEEKEEEINDNVNKQYIRKKSTKKVKFMNEDKKSTDNDLNKKGKKKRIRESIHLRRSQNIKYEPINENNHHGDNINRKYRKKKSKKYKIPGADADADDKNKGNFNNNNNFNKDNEMEYKKDIDNNNNNQDSNTQRSNKKSEGEENGESENYNNYIFNNMTKGAHIIRKRFVKNIEFEKFLMSHYTITNFQSKNNGKKNEKEMLKYIPCKQITFNLYAIYDYYSDENENENLDSDRFAKGRVYSNHYKRGKNELNNVNNNNKNDEENINNSFNYIKYNNNYNRGKNDNLKNKKNSMQSIDYYKNNLTLSNKTRKKRNSVLINNKNNMNIFDNIDYKSKMFKDDSNYNKKNGFIDKPPIDKNDNDMNDINNKKNNYQNGLEICNNNNDNYYGNKNITKKYKKYKNNNINNNFDTTKNNIGYQNNEKYINDIINKDDINNISINNNNNCRYEEKLSNIEKKKEDLINDTINNNILITNNNQGNNRNNDGVVKNKNSSKFNTTYKVKNNNSTKNKEYKYYEYGDTNYDNYNNSIEKKDINNNINKKTVKTGKKGDENNNNNSNNNNINNSSYNLYSSLYSKLISNRANNNKTDEKYNIIYKDKGKDKDNNNITNNNYISNCNSVKFITIEGDYYRIKPKIIKRNDRNQSPLYFDNDFNDNKKKDNSHFIIDKNHYIYKRKKYDDPEVITSPTTIHKVKCKKAKIKFFKPSKYLFEPQTHIRKGNLYDNYKNHNSTGNISFVLNNDNNKKRKNKNRLMKTHCYKNNYEISDSEDYSKIISKCMSLSADKRTNKHKNKIHKSRQINTINYNSEKKIDIFHKKIFFPGSHSNIKKHFFGGENKKSKNNLLSKKNYKNNSMPNMPNINDLKDFKRHNEMTGMDAIKSKFKKKLIEINDGLLDAIHYYNGPIDISCISCKNYAETVEDIKKGFLQKGFKSLKSENNYLKFTNGLDTYLIEIVIIKNNRLYCLILKNQ